MYANKYCSFLKCELKKDIGWVVFDKPMMKYKMYTNPLPIILL